MKKSINKKVFAIILSAVCAVSAISVTSAVAVSAFSGQNSVSGSADTAVIIAKTTSNTFILPIKGYDWNYYADSLNTKVTCDFDYSSNVCRFRFTAVKSGVTNVILKTQREDGRWDNTPIRITADSDLRMTIVQISSTTITEKSYTETKTPEKKQESAEKQETAKKQDETQKPAANQKSVCYFSIKGNDWTYYADSLNAKVTCDFDYANNVCNFAFTAVTPGKTNVILKTQRSDGRWNNTPVCVTVNNNMEISASQSGEVYVTDKSYTA